MHKRVAVIALLLLAGILSWSSLTKRRWGPDLLRDPMYQSGRPSLCKGPGVTGDSIPVRSQDLGKRPRSSGLDHSWAYTFEAGDLKGGVIHLCSEYGSLRLQGIEGPRGRLVVTMSDPFPGGERAIEDTRVNISVRADTGGLHVSLWQQTQGMTTFRSMLAKGARPVAVNVLLELPRSGVYSLSLIVNHQRVRVRGLDVRGLIEGYLSPGADLDVGLGGPLTLRLNGETLKADWRREAGVDFLGGTSGTFRLLGTASVDAIVSKGDIALTFVGSDVGLDVIANAKPAPATVDIGPAEAGRVDTAGTYARSAGYGNATRKVQIRATSGGGAVIIRRSTRESTPR
jgi:hypothetical protein